jgi:hypothetical protein
MPDDLVGKRGRVTGRVGPGTVGEVSLSFMGGSYTYLAHPSDGESTYETGTSVLVVDFSAPLTVYVEGAQSSKTTDRHRAFQE